MDALATEADLSARGIDTSNAARVTALLGAASAAIRDAAGCAISKETSTITLTGDTDQWLRMPLPAVSAVTDVTLNGTPVEASLIDGMLWRSGGWRSGCEPSVVSVTVTHGYDPVPADIVDLCCSLVAAGMAAAEDGYDPLRGLTGLGLDDYRESYAQGENEIVNPLELPARTRDWLRQRFGGSVHVVGTY